MATLKPYLDLRWKNAKGLFPLRLAVNHCGKTAFITLNVELKKDQWDKRRCLVTNHPRKVFLNSYLNDVLARYQQKLLTAAKSNIRIADMKATQIRDWLAEVTQPDKPVTTTFKSVFDRFTASHTNKRTHDIYVATWRKIAAYDECADKLTFEDMNKAWLEDFYAWMEKTSPSANARNIHMRNIRAVFNEAIDNELTTAYPFRRLKFRPVQTAKRNLSSEDLMKVFNAEVSPRQKKYLDAFRLSFLLIGINMADLLSLKHGSMHGGRIVYNRKKTHRLYSVKVEPEAKAIIDEYAGSELLLSFAEKYKNPRYFFVKINPTLQTIREGLTTYYARHSWATIAASLDIPKDTIAQALGHSQNTVTDVYIEFDRRKVDEANRKVIDWVLYGRK